MESNEGSFLRSSRSGEGGQPVALITQLMQNRADVQHVDDVLQWVANVLVQLIGIGIVQFWAIQEYTSGQKRPELRTVAQSFPIPRQIHANAQVFSVIEQVFREKHGVMSVPVARVFPASQVSLFKQRQLSYWTSFYITRSDLLPPLREGQIAEKLATPVSIVVSLLTTQAVESQNLRAINFVLEQSLRIARSWNLFATSADEPLRIFAQEAKKKLVLQLMELIPQHVHVDSVQQDKNPFAHAVVISERKARRLYAAIDGRKSLSALMVEVNQDQQDICDGLYHLLAQGHVQLCAPNGQLVDGLLILKSL